MVAYCILGQTLTIEIKKAENKVQQVLDLALSNESVLKSMKSDMFDPEKAVQWAFWKKISVLHLQKQCDTQESYSRRENFIIRGIIGKKL